MQYHGSSSSHHHHPKSPPTAVGVCGPGCLALTLGLVALIACASFGLAVWAVVRGGDAQAEARTLSLGLAQQGAAVVALQVQALQTQMLLNGNASSAAVTIDTSQSDGYGMVFHTTTTYSAGNWFIEFQNTLWDSGHYWNATNPAYFNISQTARYALALDCPNVGELLGHTASGRIEIMYFDNTPQYATCATPLAVQLITGDPPGSFEGNFYNPNAFAASLYVEAELSATGTSAVGVALDVSYSPYADATTRPEIAASDSCTFFIRYLGPATGTPLVPVVCL